MKLEIQVPLTDVQINSIVKELESKYPEVCRKIYKQGYDNGWKDNREEDDDDSYNNLSYAERYEIDRMNEEAESQYYEAKQISDATCCNSCSYGCTLRLDGTYVPNKAESIGLCSECHGSLDNCDCK